MKKASVIYQLRLDPAGRCFLVGFTTKTVVSAKRSITVVVGATETTLRQNEIVNSDVDVRIPCLLERKIKVECASENI